MTNEQPPTRFTERIPDEVITIVLVVLIFAAFVGIGAALGLDEGGSEAAPTTASTTEGPSTTPAPVTTVPTTSDAPGTSAPEETNPPSTQDPATTNPTEPLLDLALDVLVTDAGSLTTLTAPEGDDRLFFTTRGGKVRMLKGDTYVDEAFLDLTDRVGSRGIEQGLLGLAFHPDYEDNGRLFAYFTDSEGNRQLSEFKVTSDPDVADPDSEKVILELPQPAGSTDIRHYGGMVQFGPDGHLYVSSGDGANGRVTGQDPNSLYGVIIRIDVDAGDPYSVPDDNPFVDGGGAAEVWAYGLRNPWRFTVDPVDELLIVGDVGHDVWEEIDVLDLNSDAGANLGWANVEGNRCFAEADCDVEAYHVPAVTYTHEDGCSVTGGHVYRGLKIPELAGHYFYTDWCTGFVKSFRYQNGRVTQEQDWSSAFSEVSSINSFGLGGDGEMYVVTHTGTVARIVPVRG